MKNEQILKILKIIIPMVLIMFICDLVFSFDAITDPIADLIENAPSKKMIYFFIWLIMFVQVCFIPVPGYVVLNASLYLKIINPSLGIIGMLQSSQFWFYILIVMSAYMLGAIIAYGMGRLWGKRALEWCAGSDEDYDLWCTFIRNKGKVPYLLTILLPTFPDDMLCIITGSVKFPFWDFLWMNLVGRTIGLTAAILALGAVHNISKDGIPWSVVFTFIGLIVLMIVHHIYNKRVIKERNSK